VLGRELGSQNKNSGIQIGGNSPFGRASLAGMDAWGSRQREPSVEQSDVLSAALVREVQIQLPPPPT
jgi:hypothetical protein